MLNTVEYDHFQFIFKAFEKDNETTEKFINLNYPATGLEPTIT